MQDDIESFDPLMWDVIKNRPAIPARALAQLEGDNAQASMVATTVGQLEKAKRRTTQNAVHYLHMSLIEFLLM